MTLQEELEQALEVARTRPKMAKSYIAEASGLFLGFRCGDIIWLKDRECWSIMFYTEQVSATASQGELCKIFLGEVRSLGY